VEGAEEKRKREKKERREEGVRLTFPLVPLPRRIKASKILPKPIQTHFTNYFF